MVALPRQLVLSFLCVAGPAAFLSTASPASAEWFADVYGGAVHTPRSDVTLTVNNPASTPADHTFQSVKWNDSPTYGGRAGYWFEAVPWYGVGLDVFHFNSDIPTQMVPLTVRGATVTANLQAIDFSITALAFDLVRLRAPLLVSEDHPNGRLQPYVTVGPALFFTRARNTTNSELIGNQNAKDTAVGFKGGAGASWQIHRYVALFGEYRFTHFRAEPVFNSAGSGIPIPLGTDINTHHLLGGISFRY